MAFLRYLFAFDYYYYYYYEKAEITVDFQKYFMYNDIRS